MSERMGLPMVSDTLRNEANVIQEAAKRASEQMMRCHDSVRAAHARIRELETVLTGQPPASVVARALDNMIECAESLVKHERLTDNGVRNVTKMIEHAKGVYAAIDVAAGTANQSSSRETK